MTRRDKKMPSIITLTSFAASLAVALALWRCIDKISRLTVANANLLNQLADRTLEVETLQIVLAQTRQSNATLAQLYNHRVMSSQQPMIDHRGGTHVPGFRLITKGQKR